MGRLQGDQNPQASQHPEDQNPQAPQYPPEVPLVHQYPPSNVAPAAGYPPKSPEKPAQFSYQPPGGAEAYPPPSQAQHQAVPFPPNAPQPYNVNPQAAAFRPQPVNYPPADGQPYQRQQYGQATFGGYGAHVGTIPWTSDLFDCMNDPTNTLITVCFPCVTFGQVAEILDNGTTPCVTSGVIYGALACLGVPCILSCTYRTKLRAKYDLLETPAPDLFTHFLCECCALCQEYRELRARGLDPGIGWQTNMILQAQRQQQAALAPPVHQTMAAP